MYIPVSSELVKSTGLQQNEAESQPRKYVMSGRKKCMHKHHFVPDAYTTVSKATKANLLYAKLQYKHTRYYYLFRP